MDSYDLVDKAEKNLANALARYRRFTNLTNLFQLIEVFVAVVLISWSSTRLPLVFKISGEFLVALSSYVMNQHVVFLVGNVIVVVCYVLSRRSEAGNESGGSGIYYGDLKYSINNNQKITVDAPKAKPVVAVVESPITREAAAAVTKSRNRIITNEKAIIKTESEVTAEAAIKQATKQIERFQRTQSVKLKSEISMKPRRELRRSVTEGKNGVLTSTSVDRLSNEEFRIAVEAFISKQQSFLKQQSMVDNGS